MSRPQHSSLAGQRAKQLRQDLTVAEAMVWSGIKGGATGAHFRRQLAIGFWIVDFAALRPKLAVEIDDESHLYRDEDERTACIESLGIPLLRFWNHEVRRDCRAVVSTIAYWVEHLRLTGRPPD